MVAKRMEHQAFGEHGMIRHGFELWEELVRVPGFGPGSARRLITKRAGLTLRGLSDLRRLGVVTVLQDGEVLRRLTSADGSAPQA